jgi:hypothetical protein
MSARELAEDRETVAALDAAVARFKALLGSDDGDALYRARTDVSEAMLRCLFRAARLRGERGREG